jgi:hypothetical protein
LAAAVVVGLGCVRLGSLGAKPAFILHRLDDFGVSIVLDYSVREQGTLRG